MKPTAPHPLPLVLAALAAGCGGGSQTASPEVAVRAVEAGAAPATAAPDAAPRASSAAPSKQPEIALAVSVPQDFACALKTPEWTPQGGLTALATKPAGEAFANGYGGDATLWLPTGKPSAPTLELAHGGVVVRGFIPAGDVVLRAASPFTVGAFLVPKPEARLSWTGGASGRLEVGLAVPAQLRAKRAVEVADRPCADLALDEHAFEAIKVMFGENLSGARLEARSVPIAPTASGGTEAMLSNETTSRWVTILKKEEKKTRVAFELGPAIVFGWVDSALVITRGGGWRSRAPRVTFGAPKNESSAAERRFCPEDVALYAERDGQREIVGRISEGTTIHVDERGPEWSRVTVVASKIIPAKDVRFVVRTERLDQCTEALPKAAQKAQPSATP